MRKSKTTHEFIDGLFQFDDSPYLAYRLKNLGKLFDHLDVEKRMLCEEAAKNLELMHAALHEAAAIVYEKAPDDAGAEQ